MTEQSNTAVDDRMKPAGETESSKAHPKEPSMKYLSKLRPSPSGRNALFWAMFQGAIIIGILNLIDRPLSDHWAALTLMIMLGLLMAVNLLIWFFAISPESWGLRPKSESQDISGQS